VADPGFGKRRADWAWDQAFIGEEFGDSCPLRLEAAIVTGSNPSLNLYN